MCDQGQLLAVITQLIRIKLFLSPLFIRTQNVAHVMEAFRGLCFECTMRLKGTSSMTSDSNMLGCNCGRRCKFGAMTHCRQLVGVDLGTGRRRYN